MTPTPIDADQFADEADVLAERLGSMPDEGLTEELVVDNRVFARITDGIYRRPSSALRELIFNAYDADATVVNISTDYPRFTRMEIKDNGNGMTAVQLSNLLKHIGGSSKRTNRGREIGTASIDNPDLSPKQRQLIGKIGIGLFAVAHLTTHFQITTKAKGETHWLTANIWLKTYTEDSLREASADGDKPKFVTGDVHITRTPAESIDSQGTTVTLFDIRQGTQDILRRKELWESLIESNRLGDERNDSIQVNRPDQRVPPTYHIGFTDEDHVTYKVPQNLPWSHDDSPDERFRKFYDCVAQGSKATTKNPDIDEYLDEYLSMMWRLSLAAPLPYIEEHPFEIKINNGIEVYRLENKVKGRAVRLESDNEEMVGEAMNLTSPTDPVGGFDVYIDGTRLFRPTTLPKELAKSNRTQSLTKPLLFIGSVKSSLGNFESSRSGGALEFDAYFYWNTVIVPKQNRGALIRINNASGVLYDETFLDYRVSELNRLAQISAEIFVKKGLDAALNIDRESFNVSHPHYQYLTKWVHSSLRQITNLLKDSGKKLRDQKKDLARTGTIAALSELLQEVWEARGDPLEDPPSFVVVEKTSEHKAHQLRLTGDHAFEIKSELIAAGKQPSNTVSSVGAIDTTKAIFSVLAAYGVLEKLDYAEQESLFEDVLKILTTEAEG